MRIDQREVCKAFTARKEKIENSLKTVVEISCENKSKETISLWDTGATNSCISIDVVQSLGLIPTGKMNISTPSGKGVVNTYLVDVVLPNDVSIKNLMVCDSQIGSQGIGMLVGMDIISKGDFCVSNFQGKTTFSFRMPSNSTTDFVKEIRIENIIGNKHGRGKGKKKK